MAGNPQNWGQTLRRLDTTCGSQITRRALLRGSLAAAAALGVTRGAWAQQMQTHMPPGVAPKPRGPLVFLDYDKDELDASYNQAPWAPNQA
jgi:hypothetical protein